MRFHWKVEEPTLPTKRSSMRKLKEVLRLRYELGLGQRQVARSCSIGQGTVYEYLKRAQVAGVTWPLPEGWDDRQLEAALFGGTPRRVYENRKVTPDFARLYEELQRHSHLTLQLAWEEYRQAHPDACRYEPDLNRTYHELAMHYGVAVLPARPYKPRDKAKVETGVQIVQRWIVAALRHRKFFSLAELNQAIRELLTKLNQRPFRKRPGCRASLFQELDRPALGPLPRERYEFHQWATARVNIDYHVEFDRHYYSVPYTLTGQLVELRATMTTVEIFHRGERVASHPRSRQTYQATTQAEHRPKSHQQHLAWPPSRLLHWAESVGPATAQLFAAILESRPHPEMGYRSCLGILRLGQRYANERLEAAAARAVSTGACSYRSVKSILERGLDRQPLQVPAARPPLEHSNLRGAFYFDPSPRPRVQ